MVLMRRTSVGPTRARKPSKGKPESPSTGWPPKPERMRAILRLLDKLYPAADCELDRQNPFQLLSATILSAQCTDERVNMVTPALFARFPTPAAMGQAEQSEVESLIRSTGFFRNKAKNLIGASRLLVERWGGEVPRTMDELLQLPGVARKTANVVLGTAYGVAVGVVVDTHVTRLSGRLGLSRETAPEKIEAELMKIVPRDRWILFSHQIIWHGRRVCEARKPKCDACPLAPHCPSAFQAA
jgi:endonuclease III